jgi:predicted nucleotidyltransferase
MTIARKLRALMDENIADYRTEGKNKVYFLKKSIEGRNAAMIAEIYKQSRIVSTYPVLRGIFTAIHEEREIPLALLYGSYAKGTPKENSDIDIYIDTLNFRVKKQLEERHSSLSVKIGEFDLRSLLIQEIIRDHVIIKGVEAYFDKTGLFEKTV